MSYRAGPAEFRDVEFFRHDTEDFVARREDSFVNYPAHQPLDPVERAAAIGLGSRGPESRGGT